MADTNDATNNFDASKYNDKFKEWYNNNKGRFDTDAQTPDGQEKIKKAKQEYDDAQNSSGGNSKSGEGKDGSETPEEKKENNSSLTVSQGGAEKSEENQNKDWIEQKRESWSQWSGNHQPAYTYDEDSGFDSGLKFDVYKDADKKEKLATVQYNAPRDVSVSGDDGKVPPLEFFDKMIKDAKEVDHVPGVTFSGEMTDDFKAKLAVACIKNGLPMTNGPDHIDINTLGENISEDLKSKVETFNKTKSAEKAYNKAKERAAQFKTDNPDKAVNIKELMGDDKNPTLAAIIYAGYANAGIKVEGIDEFNKDTHGAFQSSDLKYFPDEALQTVVNFNYEARKKQIAGIRQSLEEKIASGDQEALDKRVERDNVAQARENIRQGKDIETSRQIIQARQAKMKPQSDR